MIMLQSIYISSSSSSKRLYCLHGQLRHRNHHHLHCHSTLIKANNSMSHKNPLSLLSQNQFLLIMQIFTAVIIIKVMTMTAPPNFIKKINFNSTLNKNNCKRLNSNKKGKINSSSQQQHRKESSLSTQQANKRS